MRQRSRKLSFDNTFEMFIQVWKHILVVLGDGYYCCHSPTENPLWTESLNMNKLMFPVNIMFWEASIYCRVAPNTTSYWSLQDCWQCLVETWTQQCGQQWSGKWEWIQGWWSTILRRFGEAESSDDTENVVQKVCTLSTKVLGDSSSLVGSVKNTELFCIPFSWLISMARGLLSEDHSKALERT